MARTLLQGTVLLAIAAVTVMSLGDMDVMPQDLEIMLDILRAQEIVPLPADKQPGHCPSWLHNASQGQDWLAAQIANITDAEALQAFETAYGSYFPGGFNVSYYLQLWHDEAIKDGSLDLGSLSGFFPTEMPTPAPMTETTTTGETTTTPTTETTTTTTEAPTTETTTTHELTPAPTPAPTTETTTTRPPTTETTTTTTRPPTTETTTTTTTRPPTTETTTTTLPPTTETTTTTTRPPTTETTTTTTRPPTTETTTATETTTTTHELTPAPTPAPTTETTTTRPPTTETTTTTRPPTTETTTTRPPTTETTTTRPPTTETTTTPSESTTTHAPLALHSVRRLLQTPDAPATPSPTQLEANVAEVLRRKLIQLLVVERKVAFDDTTKDCVTRRYPDATLPPVAPTTTVITTTTTVAPTSPITTTATPATTAAPNTTAAPATTAAPNTTTSTMPNTTATLTPFTTTGSHAPTTTGATTSTVAPTTTTAAPTTTPAPSAGVTFPYPPAVPSAYANDRVYKEIYDAVASSSLQVALPLPAGCPATLATGPSAQNLFESLIEAQTDVRTIVTSFLRNHTIDNFNSEAFIAYFAQTTMPGMMAVRFFEIEPLTNSSNTTAPLSTTTGTATTAAPTTATAPPPTSASTAAPTTATPSPTPEAAVMVSELDIMKNGNARIQLLQSYGFCFVSNPNATFPEPTQTDARVFSADIADGETFSVDFFKAQLTQYFATNGVVPEFNVSVSGNQVTITILSTGDVGAVAAAALLQMPAGQQTNFGIRNLAAASEPSTPAPAEEKKSKLWIIGVVVGAVVVVAIVALVITRRRASRGNSAGVGAFDSELNASSEFHRTEYNRV